MIQTREKVAALVERLRNPRVVHLHRNASVSSDCVLHAAAA
jgi:hypothetical protein